MQSSSTSKFASSLYFSLFFFVGLYVLFIFMYELFINLWVCIYAFLMGCSFVKYLF